MKMLYDKINKNLTQARKARDQFSVTLLSTVKGELGRISDGKPEKLTDDQIIKKIRTIVEGIELSGEQSGTINQRELDILDFYLPQMLSEEQVKTFVENMIKDTGAETLKDIGTVMQALKPHAAIMDMKIASIHAKLLLGAS